MDDNNPSEKLVSSRLYRAAEKHQGGGIKEHEKTKYTQGLHNTAKESVSEMVTSK